MTATRAYYRQKMGYRSDGTYMVKDLIEGRKPKSQKSHLFEDEDLDLFEERVVAPIGSVDAAGGVPAIKVLQQNMLRQCLNFVVALCLVTYLVSQLLPILCALLLSVFYMGALNYALFWSVPFGATARTNKPLLSMSRLTLLLLDLALFGKLGSALLPTWTVRDFDALGLGFVAVAMGLDIDPSEGDCLCNSFWTLS